MGKELWILLVEGSYLGRAWFCFVFCRSRNDTRQHMLTLMENCERDSTISVDDGLACLDQCGVVAEMGARILYVLTVRDGLGWHGAGYNRIAVSC